MIALAIEIDSAEQIAMIGHCYGRHLEFLCLFYQVLNTDCAIKEAVFCMQVEGYVIRV